MGGVTWADDSTLVGEPLACDECGAWLFEHEKVSGKFCGRSCCSDGMIKLDPIEPLESLETKRDKVAW